MMLRELITTLLAEGALKVGKAAWLVWTKSTTVQSAIKKVDDHFYAAKNYRNVAERLEAWVTDSAVVDAIDGLANGKPPSESTIETLVDRLGYEPREIGNEVLGAFFQALYDELLNSSHGHALMLKHLDHKFGELRTEISQRSEPTNNSEQFENVSRAMMPESHGDEAYDLVKQMIRTGKHRASLVLLDAKETLMTPSEGEDSRYELHANRGIALLHLERFKDAETELRRALDLKRTRPNALANLALVLLVQGNADEAITLVDRALAIEADNESAKKVKAQALSRLGRHDEAKAVARSIAIDKDRAEILGLLSLNATDNLTAIEELRRTLAHDPGNVDAMLFIAQAEIREFQAQVDQLAAAPWSTKPANVEELVTDAEKHLSSAIDAIDEAESPLKVARALLSRVAIRAYRDDPDAIADYRKGTALGGLAADATKIVFGLMHRTGQGDAAKVVLEEYRERSLEPNAEIEMLYVAALDQAGEHAEAIARLDSLIEAAEDKTELLLMRVDLKLTHRELTNLKQDIESLTSAPSWERKMRLARLSALEGDFEHARATIREAIAEAPAPKRWALQEFLVDYLLQQERWGDAHAELQSLVNTSAPIGLLYKYVIALYNDRHLGECIEFGRAVREKRGIIPIVAFVEARALSAVGRVDEADKLLIDLQATGDDQPEWRLERSQLALRRGDPKMALNLCPDAPEAELLPFEKAMIAAEVRLLAGDFESSLEIAYRARLKNPTRQDAYLKYVGLFLRIDQAAPSLVNADTAEVGTSVTLQRESETQEFELVQDADNDDAHCAIGSPLGIRLKGRKVGDELVLLKDVHGEEKWTIARIRSRFVVLFQRSLAEFTTRFPDTQGLRRVTIAEGDLGPILRSVDQRELFISQTREVYQNYPLPVGTLGNLIGSNDVEAWYALTSGIFGPFYAYPPEPRSQGEMRSNLVEATECVLEATTICALAELGKLDKLIHVGKPLSVSRATMDLLNSLRDNLKPESTATLGKRDGQYILAETTEDQLERQRKFWDTTISWMTANAKVAHYDVPAGPQLKELATLYSEAAFSSVLVAKTNKAVLITDDLRLRQMAATTDVRGCSSLEVCDALLNAGNISTDEHLEMLVKIARWHYYFMPITVDMLKTALRLDGLTVGPNLQGLLEVIQDPRTAGASVAKILAHFLKDVWVERKVAEIAEQSIVFACLNALALRPGWRADVRLFQAALNANFALIPIHLKQVGQLIELWAKMRIGG